LAKILVRKALYPARGNESILYFCFGCFAPRAVTPGNLRHAGWHAVHLADAVNASLVSTAIPRRPDGHCSFPFVDRAPSSRFLLQPLLAVFFLPLLLEWTEPDLLLRTILPLLSFAGYFDPFDFGFGGESLDVGNDNDLNSQAPGQAEMSAIPPAVNSPDDDTAEGNSLALPETMSGAPTGQESLGNGVFLLVLKNGTSRAVTDYWVADGYLEYISPDGSRSHFPLEALDLQNTVTQNAPRGLPFVLRFAPAQNR